MYIYIWIPIQLGFYGNLFSTLDRARDSNGVSCMRHINNMLGDYYFLTDQVRMCIYTYDYVYSYRVSVM